MIRRKSAALLESPPLLNSVVWTLSWATVQRAYSNGDKEMRFGRFDPKDAHSGSPADPNSGAGSLAAATAQ
jgi:hypothetical protein